MKSNRSIKRRLNRGIFVKQRIPQFGLLGNYNHIVEVPDRPNYVYVRFAGQVLSQVFNDRVAPLEDLEVLVGYDPEEPNLYQVLDIRSNLKRYNEDDDTTNYVPEHHRTHEWMQYPGGGNDVVFVDLRQFMPIRTSPMPTGVSLLVHRGIIYGGDEYGWGYVTGGFVDFSAALPSEGVSGSINARFALLSLDQNGMPVITTGDAKSILLLGLDDVPDPNPGCLPLALIRLYSNQTRISEAFSNTDIADLRFPGARGFLTMYDVPSSYTGSAGKAVFVNEFENGLIFANVSSDSNSSTGSFVNPMIYRGDMIYSDLGGTAGRDVAEYTYGTRATGSSVYDSTFTPANYALSYTVGGNDIWSSLVWTSQGGLGYYFNTAYITIQLTGTYNLLGWRLRENPTATPSNKASQYEVATWNGSSWDIQATRTKESSDEYVLFSSPVTTKFVRFRGIANELGQVTGSAWSIEKIGLYEATLGQTPTRLPYGSVGQVLTVQDISGSVPRFNYLAGDITGTWNNLQVQGILGKGIYGTPRNGDYIYFNSGTNRWELSSGTSGGAGASNFIDLTDTPSSYTGSANKFLKVAANETGVEFAFSINGWYSPLDYGAVGDGIADDSMAISGTIAAIPSSGGVLYFPPGYTFKTGGGHKLNKPITVKGMGNANNFDTHSGISTIVCSSGSSVLFEVNAYKCSFEDLFLMGQTGTTPTAGAGISVVSGGDFMHFQNVTVHSFYYGIDMQDGFGWSMNQCKFINTAKYGVKIQHVGFVDGGDQFIDNCMFWADGRTSDAGIRQESGGGLKITNTKIVGSGQSDKQYHYGIDVYLGSAVTTSVLLIDNVSIENVDTNAIRVVTSPSPSSILYNVQLNNLELAVNDKGVGSAAIYMSNQVTGTLQWVTLDNIICYDWNDSITDEAIYLDGLDHVRVGAILRDGFSGDLAIPNCTDVQYYVTGSSGGGATTFLGLTDTPSSYAGQSGKVVAVNGSATALEFISITGTSGGGSSGDIAVSSFVGARYTSDGSRILFGAGAEAVIPLNKKVYDTHNAVTTGSSWRFYAPEDGYYLVEGSLTLGAASWSTSQWAEWYVYKSGTSFGTHSLFNGDIKNGVGTTINMCVGGKSVVFLKAGEWISPYLYNTHASNQYMITGSAYDFYSFISITKIVSEFYPLAKIPIFDDGVFKVTGSAISFDSNLTVSVTGSVAFISSISTGTSGGGGISITGTALTSLYNIWDVDAPPTGSSVYDIEPGLSTFVTGTYWGKFDPGGIFTYTQEQNVLRFYNSTGTTNNTYLSGLYHSVPTGTNYTVTVKLGLPSPNIGSSSNTSPQIGLALFQTGSDSSRDIIAWRIGHAQSGRYYLYYSRFADYRTWTANDYAVAQHHYLALWLRIRREGSTYHCEKSIDGYTWETVYDGTPAFEPEKIGLMYSQWLSTHPKGLIHYYRYEENLVEVGSPTKGRERSIFSGATYIPTGTSSSFLGLSDTPSTYSGSAGKALIVNTGTSAIEFAHGYPFFTRLTPPNYSDFTWVNQGSGTVVDYPRGGFSMYCQAENIISYHMLTRNVTGTYTTTALLAPLCLGENYMSVGIGWRQSSDGKLVLQRLLWNLTDGGVVLALLKASNATTDVANYINVPIRAYPPYVWFQWGDDGTNRFMKWSTDGEFYNTLHTVSRTDYLTADQICAFVCPRNANHPARLTVLSWKET
jgi:hypothetical protein